MKGKNYFSPLPLEEARENLNSNSSKTNLLPSEMAFRVPVGRGRGGRRGRPVANAKVMEELRILREEMAAMREAGRRDPEAGDVSEVEQEDEHC
jgi:hypothetical protein